MFRLQLIEKKYLYLPLALNLALGSALTQAQEVEDSDNSGGVETWALSDLAFMTQRNSAVPPLSQNLESQRSIMLTLSVDHQLFFEAYNAYDDIYQEEGEAFPVPETTYTHSFNYVGYYDPKLCYSYSDSGGVFAAAGRAGDDGYCTDSAGVDGGWSGNFLNWATMTRMDLVRFVLYGGYRHIDTGPSEDGDGESVAARTVLERAYLPQDAHSFAKYYNGDDIAKLTHFSAPQCEGSDVQCAGFTFCSTTRPNLAHRDAFSQDERVLREPPLLRVAKGNHSLWASNERYQCLVEEEVPGTGWSVEQGKNGNNPELTGINAFGESPSRTEVHDFVVRVEVCKTSGVVKESFCKMYASDSHKPVGILQEQGESGEVEFGLITGSYEANKSFGALRKNISSFAEEVNPDGTFVFPSLKKLLDDGGLPEDFPLPNSIIGNLNALRIIDYKFIAGGDSEAERGEWQGTYNDTCHWRETTFGNGSCRNWGNPFNELLAESYLYYSGSNKLAFDENDAGEIPGLSVATWEPAQGAPGASECPNMNVIGFNASSVSFDAEPVASEENGYQTLYDKTTAILFGDGVEDSTVLDLTNFIGAQELDGGSYFVGEVSGSTVDGQCTAKEITNNNLSLVAGTCPEAPNSKGGYWGTGLAHFVHTNDVNPRTDRKDTISTYGVTLAGALPNITIAVPPTFTKKIQIIPACRNLGGNIDDGNDDGGNCALVSFMPVETFAERSQGVYSGKYYVGWEDAEQGGDFDLDLGGSISFTISQSDMTGAQLTVSTQIISESAADIMEFGFIVSGTGSIRDRAYFPSRISADDYGGVDDNTRGTDCAEGNLHRCASAGQRQTITFDLTEGTTGEFLESPLYYASKWGGFDDRNNNGIVDDGEWDGSSYAEVTDPSRLKEQLGKVIDSIIDKPVAGTGAAVATTALTGEGLILSNLFLPSTGEGAAKLQWAGRLNGLFRAYGETWEDNASPGERTDADNVVRFYADEATGSTVFSRHRAERDEYGNYSFTLVQEDVPYSQLMPVWNARDQLAAIPQEDISDNRDYGRPANTGRHIFTAIDVDGDGIAEFSEVIDFTANNFSSDTATEVGLGPLNFKFLDVVTAENAGNVVNYIRGQEGIAGFRNRTVTVSKTVRSQAGVSVQQVEMPWLLGDIAHSTPVLVGRPNELYDSSRLNDESYREFRDAYAKRRLVTYVGANDGMLHAFNGGFAGVETTADPEDAPNSFTYRTLPEEGADGITAHPLGAELWAYTPYNLLPQLKWLTDPNYRHVYYVDSNVNQFDVNIFEPSETHPHGWGSIIVVGMRFGGSDAEIDLGDDNRDNPTLRSAYIIFDVTDPESPPKLLGEITHENLGYTIGDIDVVSFRDPHSTGSYLRNENGQIALPPKNKWYLVFGSGPRGAEGLSKASSDQAARLFTLDLNTLASGTGRADRLLQEVEISGASNSFVGGLTAMDWDDDFDDDMIYFGTVGTGTAEGAPKGALMQASLSYNHNSGRLTVTPSPLLSDVDLPFSREPLTIKESANGGFWVYAASGKFLVRDDLTEVDDNRMFGVRVNSPPGARVPWLTSTSRDASALVDAAAYTVTTEPVRNEQGDIIDRTYTVTGEGGATTFDDVALSIRNAGGWFRDMDAGELSSTRPFYFGTTLGVSTFLPEVNDCSPSGGAAIYVLNLFSGLPQTDSGTIIGPDGTFYSVDDDYEGEVGSKILVEKGPPLDPAPPGPDGPSLPLPDGSEKDLPFGAKPVKTIRTSWREITPE